MFSMNRFVNRQILPKQKSDEGLGEEQFVGNLRRHGEAAKGRLWVFLVCRFEMEGISFDSHCF